MRQIRNAEGIWERGKPSPLKSILHIDAIQRKHAWLTVLFDSGRKVYENPSDHVSTRTCVAWPPPPRATQEALPHLPGLWVNFNFLQVYLCTVTVHPGQGSAPLWVPCWHLKPSWIDPAGSLLMGRIRSIIHGHFSPPYHTRQETMHSPNFGPFTALS